MYIWYIISISCSVLKIKLGGQAKAMEGCE